MSEAPKGVTLRACRGCGGDVEQVLDLGRSPAANALVSAPGQSVAQYPLGLCECLSCGLVQNAVNLPTSALFDDDYPYLSATSAAVRANAADLAAQAAAQVGAGARALDVGSNDGTVQRALAAQNIPCFGVDPAPVAIAQARAQGCACHCAAFDAAAADVVLAEFGAVDVITMCNVLAHVPDPAALLSAAARVLTPSGILVIEVQSWAALVDLGAFDMVYHEHHAHFSLPSLLSLIARAGFRATRVERTMMQGGSLRVWCTQGTDHASDVVAAAKAEQAALVNAPARLGQAVAACLSSADGFRAETAGKRVAGFGAAAKTVTLLAASGSDLGVTRIADNASSKIGRYLPLHDIPIVSPDAMLATEPDVVLVFAWNLIDELLPKLGGKEVWVPFPTFRRVT